MNRIRICSSEKRTFLTAQDAWRRLCELRRIDRKVGRKHPIRVYECPECGGWHLTSTKNRTT